MWARYKHLSVIFWKENMQTKGSLWKGQVEKSKFLILEEKPLFQHLQSWMEGSPEFLLEQQPKLKC